MKKSILYSAVALAMVAAGSSCSSDYDIYPEEYSQVLMIKDAGEHAMTVYSTDTKVPFAVTIFKGGHTKGEATVTLRSMTSDEFAEYQLESGKPYQAMSADCFSFSETEQTQSVEVKFGADESYKVVNVYVNADEVGDFLESFDNSLYSAVIPVKIESDNTIDTDGVNTFIVPSYKELSVVFGEGEMEDNYRMLNLSNGKFKTTITLPVENIWGLTVGLEYDATLVEKYNAAHKTSYTAIPKEAISGLSETYSMPVGQSSVEVSLDVDPSKIAVVSDVLPVKIVVLDDSGISGDADLGWMLADTRSETRINLTADMLWSNALEPYEGSLASMLDGDLETFFHSAWSWAVTGRHGLGINLPKAYSSVIIEYSNRASGNQVNALGLFYMFTAGPGDANYTYRRTFDSGADGLNTEFAGTTVLPALVFDKPQNMFLIEQERSCNGNSYFVITELKMYGV